MGRIADKLLARLRRDGFADRFPSGSVLRRLRAGRHQRAAGAWLWCGDGNLAASNTGSTYTMSELLASNSLERLDSRIGTTEVFPAHPTLGEEKSND